MNHEKSLSSQQIHDLDFLCARAHGFSSDSREIVDGAIFVALTGGTYDGAKFIKAVLSQYHRAFAVTQSQEVFLSLEDDQKHRTLLVESSHAAHRHIAKNFRIKFQGKVIAIGGSNGKTSTKEFLFHILSSKFRVVKTNASQNGELGIPKTLEKLHPLDQSPVDVAVVEVGIDGPGDMIRHVEIVRPQIAVLTSIGEEHLNLLKNVEGVFREERVLADWCIDYGGKVFIPQEDDFLMRLVKEGKATKISKTNLERFEQPLKQNHFLSNLSLCVAVAKSMGMSHNEIQFALNTIEVPDGRGVLKSMSNNVWIYADYYNANSASMKAGIESVVLAAKDKVLDHALVLGDMFDLGEQESVVHNQVLEMAVASKPTKLILIGERFLKSVAQMGYEKHVTKAYDTLDQAIADKSNIFNEPAVYLLKGSRGMKLERLFG